MSSPSTSTALDEGKVQLLSHFDDLDQQHLSSNLGMWFFLVSEVMFFSGLIAAYAVYRTTSPLSFHLASKHMATGLGFVNTLWLLTSSLTMALAVRASQTGWRRGIVGYMLATAVLGSVFLGFKGYEYSEEIHHHLLPGRNFQIPAEDLEEMRLKSVNADGQFSEEVFSRNQGRFQMMFVLYFFMTGVHAFHMVVGIAVILVMAYLTHIRWFSGYGNTEVEVLGLYWHFVDVVWVFLYPLLYLIE